jgi:hypothetical protein
MEDGVHRSKAITRALLGGLAGAVTGAFTAGFVACVIGNILASVDAELAELRDPLVGIACALLTAPGAAIAGGIGATRLQPLPWISGAAIGMMDFLCPGALLWLVSDPQYVPPVGLLCGGGIISGAVFAGRIVGWFAIPTSGPDLPDQTGLSKNPERLHESREPEPIPSRPSAGSP